jgi:hypothetical protein
MKKTLTAMACALTLLFSASTASALAIGDANYLGSIDPATPASAAAEVGHINTLLDQASPSSTTIAGVLYVRSSNDCDGLCPDATTAGALQGQGPSGSVNVTGWTYLLGKYGTVAHVWYVGDLSGSQSVPASAPGGGLSHYSLYNPGTTTVPDGGATLGLLGLAMLGVGYLRSRMI